MSRALRHVARIEAVDCATRDALFRTVAAWNDTRPGAWDGTISTVIALATRLPERLWRHQDAALHDTRVRTKLLSLIQAGT